VLYATLNNPIFPQQYDFGALINVYSYTYSSVPIVTKSFIANTIGNITSVSLSVVPSAAAAAHAIYILKMPSKYVTTVIEVGFPFDLEL